MLNKSWTTLAILVLTASLVCFCDDDDDEPGEGTEAARQDGVDTTPCWEGNPCTALEQSYLPTCLY